ncbi:MAG: BatD family protein [Ferruginibacter sp.]
MHLFFRKILLICTCFFVYSLTHAQVNFYATVTPETINKDEYLSYRIVIENGGNIQHLTRPAQKYFELVSPPSQEGGMVNMRGQVIQYLSFEYILKPKKAGTFTIDPALATIDGKNMKSNAVTVTVKNALSGNSARTQMSPYQNYDPYAQQEPVNADISDYIFHKGDNVAEKVNKNMQLKLEVNKTSCYVGEPIVAAYKLYTRLKSDSKLSQNPSFNGFSVVDMQQPGFNDYSKEKLNGKEFNVYTIRKAQLYALQPGVINLDPAELENNVKFIKEEYARKAGNEADMFNAFAGALFPPDAIVSQNVTLESKPIDITVKPLPEENKPASFKGAVGSFNLNAALQKPLFSTDEAGKLSVTITGSGNMQLLTAPEIDWPKGIESFEPKFTDKLVNVTVPISGTKKFEYTFAANDSGHFTIPAIHFSYFDPATATYKCIETEPIVFQVTKGTGHPVAMGNLVVQNEKPSFINRIFYHRWWIVVFIATVMLMGLIIWLLKDRKPAKEKEQQQPSKEEVTAIEKILETSAQNQQNVFEKTEKCLFEDNCFGFYTLLNTELKHYLSHKFSIDQNSINSNTIVPVMDKKGISNDIVLKLQNLMHEIEWQLYTPFERNERMNALYQEAHEIIQLINTHEVKHL